MTPLSRVTTQPHVTQGQERLLSRGAPPSHVAPCRRAAPSRDGVCVCVCGQELVDNRAGCFEWFGLDFMVDSDLRVWNLECNISPDLSRGTEVPPRPAAGHS